MAKSNGSFNDLKSNFERFFNRMLFGSEYGIDDGLVYCRDCTAQSREVEIELHFTVKLKENKSDNSCKPDSQANLDNGYN